MLQPHITSVSPRPFSPNADGRNELVTVSVSLPEAQTLSYSITSRTGRTVYGPHWVGPRGAGTVRIVWDGKSNAGNRIPDGNFRITVRTSLTIGGVRLEGSDSATIASDVTAPGICCPTGNGSTFDPIPDGYKDTWAPAVTVGEGGTTVLQVKTIFGTPVARVVEFHRSAGTFRLAWNGRVSSGALASEGQYAYSFFIQDTAGNRRSTLNLRLNVTASRYARRVPLGVSASRPLSFRTFSGLARLGAPEGPKPIALTFDDGPGSRTAAVLSILEREKVPATFFMVTRQIPGREDLVRRVISSGFQVGSHSHSHPDLRRLSGEALRREVDTSLDVLRPLLGADDAVRCLRPPYGNSDAELLSLLASRGLAEAQWSIDPLDWQDPSPDTLVSRVLSHAAPGGIVLLHETHGNTVAALPGIISGLRAMGYSFVSIC